MTGQHRARTNDDYKPPLKGSYNPRHNAGCQTDNVILLLSNNILQVNRGWAMPRLTGQQHFNPNPIPPPSMDRFPVTQIRPTRDSRYRKLLTTIPFCRRVTHHQHGWRLRGEETDKKTPGPAEGNPHACWCRSFPAVRVASFLAVTASSGNRDNN